MLPDIFIPVGTEEKTERDYEKEKRRAKVKSLIDSLPQEDLISLRNIIKEKDTNLKKFGFEENPLLLAAEYGSYEILKSITELGDEIRNQKDFTLDDCNEDGENVLHLRKFHNPKYCHKSYACLYNLWNQNYKGIFYVLL